MVVIKQYTSSAIDIQPNVTGRVLYDSTLKTLRFNDSTNYNNLIITKDENNNLRNINNANTTGWLGVNTSSPDKQVEINSSTGDCLRLTNNDNNGTASNYCDFLVSASGDLSITPSGNDVDITTHNGSTTGLKLGGTLVTATATELNYVDTTQGTVEASKALVVDSSKNLTGLNNLSMDGTLDTSGAVSFYSTLDVTSNTTVGGTFGVTGATTLSSTLGVTGAATLSSTLDVTGNTTVGGTFGVTGATTLSSTLDVTGNTTIGGTLGLTGALTLNNTDDATSSTAGGCLTVAGGAAIAKKLFVGTDFNVGGNSTMTGTLGVTGAATLSSTLGVTGATTLSSTLDVTGNSTVGGTLGVTGATTLSSTLGVTGATTLSSTLDVTNAVNFNDATDATSSTAGGSLTVDGGAAIAKKLFVGTDLSVGGNSTMTGTLGVTGAATMSSTLDVTGAATISSTLGVTGATTLSSTLDVTNAVNFNDTTDATSSTAGGCLTVDGGAAIAKKLYVGSDFDVTGNSSMAGTLGVTGAATMSSTLGVTGAATMSSTLGVTGATTLSSTLDVTNAVNFNDTTDATSSTAGGCLTVDGGAAIAKKLYVGGTLGVTGNTTVGGTFGATGAATLSSTLGVTGATTLSSTLDVTGNSTIGGTLGVTGAVTMSSSLSVTGNVTIGGPALLIPKGNTATRPSPGVTGYIRYNTETSQFEGYGAGNSWGSLGGVTDVDQDTKILAETAPGEDDDNLRFFNAGTETMRLTNVGKLGVGTNSPDKQVEINSTTGDCLRLTYNDANGSAANYVDFLVSSSGDLSITPSGNDVDVTTHNGSTTGLKLGGTLITATATELNYTDTTPGTAEASKALIMDSNRNIININYLECSTGVFMKSNTNNNTVNYPISILVTPNTTAATGLGSGIEFNSTNSTDEVYNAGYISYISSNITSGSETGFFDFKLANNGVIDSIMTIGNTGVLTCTSLVETSDIRVKENIQDVNEKYSLEKVLQINVKSYNFINDVNKKLHSGVIAQEIKEVLPEVVEISERNGIEDFHGVNYTGLIPHLINCIKDLQNQINELKKN